jgi:hypothetical protein
MGLTDFRTPNSGDQPGSAKVPRCSYRAGSPEIEEFCGEELIGG